MKFCCPSKILFKKYEQKLNGVNAKKLYGLLCCIDKKCSIWSQKNQIQILMLPFIVIMKKILNLQRKNLILRINIYCSLCARHHIESIATIIFSSVVLVQFCKIHDQTMHIPPLSPVLSTSKISHSASLGPITLLTPEPGTLFSEKCYLSLHQA